MLKRGNFYFALTYIIHILTFIVKQVNILSMNVLFLNQKTPNEIAKSFADKIKEHRKKLKISQEVLAQKSGVSLGSIKRFETKYEISLQSFIKIAIALDLDNDFENLFTQKTYASIDEVINGGVNG